MKLMDRIKIAGPMGITVLLVCSSVFMGAVSGAKKVIEKETVKECTRSTLILRDVMVKEKQVTRSSSTRFVLDLMRVEVVNEESDLETGLLGQPALPRVFSLSQNYPNPFNPTTTITFDVPGTSGETQQVQLTVYNIRGKQVISLIDSELEPGNHRVVWNGRNDDGEQVSSGMYLYTLRIGDKSYTRKMVMVK